MGQIVFLVLMLVVMYFLMIRPQKARQEAQRKLMNTLAEGAEVMTTAGIFGFVTAVVDDIVWLEIANGVDIRVTKAAIAKVVTPSTTDGAIDTTITPPELPSRGTDLPGDNETTGDN
jgi:preprotein translocase subunit YajC